MGRKAVAIELVAAGIMLAATVFGCFFALQNKREPIETVTVGVELADGVTVSGDNPVRVRAGETVSFPLSLDASCTLLSADGGEYGDGVLTVIADRSRTVRLTVERPVPLTVEDGGRIEWTDGVGEDGVFYTHRPLTGRLIAPTHYLPEALLCNGEALPLDADGRFTLLLENEKAVTLAPSYLGEPVFLRLQSDRFGEIEGSFDPENARYGDRLSLRAVYDPARTEFLGWSMNADLRHGGELLDDGEELSLTLAGDTVIHANFRSRYRYTLTIDAGEGSFSTPPQPAEYGIGESVILPLDDGGLSRPGYQPVGYLDEDGRHYSFGTTILMPENDLRLTVEWTAQTPAECLRFAENADGLTVLGWTNGEEREELTVPQSVDGRQVTAIADGAFEGNGELRTVRLPVGLLAIGERAFADCRSLTALTLPETLLTMDASAFSGCDALRDLRIHASLEKVYDLDYDASLADKYLYLKESEREEKKRLILVGGSGLSFGIDGDLLRAAFPEYTVLNFSTSVYYGIRPLLGYLQNTVREGDLVIFAPEYHRDYMFGAESPEMTNWQYLESCYDMLRDLDLRENGNLLSTYITYLDGKRSFLEKGEKKYNHKLGYNRAAFDEAGCMTVERPTVAKDFSAAFPKESVLTDAGLAYLRAAIGSLGEKGAVCLLSYPAAALEEGVSVETVTERTAGFSARLERALDGVCTPISRMEDYFLPKKEFYDSMFHLSSAGATHRTVLLRDDILAYLRKEDGQ